MLLTITPRLLACDADDVSSPPLHEPCNACCQMPHRCHVHALHAHAELQNELDVASAREKGVVDARHQRHNDVRVFGRRQHLVRRALHNVELSSARDCTAARQLAGLPKALSHHVPAEEDLRGSGAQ